MIRPLLRPVPIEKKHPATLQASLCQIHLPAFWPRMLFAWCIFSICSIAAQGSPLPSGAWSGAVGPVGSTMVPDPTRPPVEFFEDGIAGVISLTLASPTQSAPNGTYTAQLVLFHGSQSLTFRYKGSLKSGGAIQDTWVASGKTPASATISLNRSVMNPEAAFLFGEATLNGSKYPLFVMPQIFGSKNLLPPAVHGNNSAFLHDLAGRMGTGYGSAKISPAGVVKLAGTTGDGLKFTQAASILLAGGHHFFAAASPVGKTGFMGLWALRDSSFADSDWNGYALHGQSPIPSSRLVLAAYTPPLRGQSAIPWTTGSLHLELNPDFFAANGNVIYDGKTRFRSAPLQTGESSGTLNGANAWGVQLKSLTFNPSSGLATGLVEYFFIPSPTSEAVRQTASIAGALNQKSGEIHGRVVAKRNSALFGPFEVAPAPQ